MKHICIIKPNKYDLKTLPKITKNNKLDQDEEPFNKTDMKKLYYADINEFNNQIKDFVEFRQ